MHLCGKLITPHKLKEANSPKCLVKGVKSICIHIEIDDLLNLVKELVEVRGYVETNVCLEKFLTFGKKIFCLKCGTIVNPS